MQVPISWLREYVDFDLSPSLLAEKLTMVGMEVGSIESTAKNWEKCISIFNYYCSKSKK